MLFTLDIRPQLILHNQSSMMKIETFVSVIYILVVSVAADSYIPRYIEGVPVVGQVVSIEKPDLRNANLYRIQHQVEVATKAIEDGLVHRTFEEFATLHQLVTDDFWLPNPAVELPVEEEATVENMNNYLLGLYGESSIRNSQVMSDFLSINWNGKDISFMYDLAGFLQMLLFERVPNFMPEPPRIEKDAAFLEETPFERYMYFIAFKHPKEETPAYLDFFTSYCETTPTWNGPMDNSDVIHPSLEAPLVYPTFYNYTYVHFLPGGYLNSQTVRISFLGNSKFTFLDESKLNEWLVKLYKTQQNSIEPKVILDIGTGTGGSAFVLGQLFPQAQVLGIDLAPAYIRFSRAHKEIRHADNVEFYQANAENLEFIESDSVDFINFAYVLHEMPADNAKAIVREMFRVLKPGGVVNGFEVPYKRNSIVRDYFVSTNTWDEDWHVQGNQGPEPYLGEYEYNVQLPLYMEEIGFKEVDEYMYSYFESIFTATK